MGKLLTRLPRLSLAQLRTLHERFGQLQFVRATETKISHRLDGKLLTRFPRVSLAQLWLTL
jgi:hypothetical protein